MSTKTTRSITALRKEFPGKVVFQLVVAEPNRGGGMVAIDGTCDEDLVAKAPDKAFVDLAMAAWRALAPSALKPIDAYYDDKAEKP